MLMPEFNVLADVTKCVSEQRTRVTCGAICLSSSSHFAPIAYSPIPLLYDLVAAIQGSRPSCTPPKHFASLVERLARALRVIRRHDMAFTLTYNGNGSDGGSVPTDGTAYNAG